MFSRVVDISGPEATKPVLPLTADSGRDIDDRDIAERKAFLAVDPEECVRLGSLHALIEPAKNAFTEAFYGHILSFEPMRRLMPDDQSLGRLRASRLEYFSRLASPGGVSNPTHDDRQTTGHEADILTALSRLFRLDDYRILRWQRPYGQDVDDYRLHYAGTGNPVHARH